jgi:hypothetical protein
MFNDKRGRVSIIGGINLQAENYRTAGIISLLASLYSIFVDKLGTQSLNLLNLFVFTGTFSYLLMHLKTYILERTRYGYAVTSLIYFTVSMVFLAPVLLLGGFFLVVNMSLFARGVGLVILGCLLLTEWRKYNILMMCVVAILTLSGVSTTVTSLFAIYPHILLKFTRESFWIFSLAKMLLQESFFILLGINFLYTYRCERKSVSVVN